MDQHFLPEFYLKGFARIKHFKEDIPNYTLFRYSIKEKNISEKSPKKIAFRKNFYSYKESPSSSNYTHEIERELSKLENKTKLLFNRINERISSIISKDDDPKILHHDEKSLLIIFVCNILKRIPKFLDSVYEHFEKDAKQLEDKYDVSISENVIKISTLSIFEELGEDEKYNFYKAFNCKNIRFIYIDNDETSFITTDNPVIMSRANNKPAGLRYSDTEIYFPINHRCLLKFYGFGSNIETVKYKNKKLVYDSNRDLSKKFNELIITRDKLLLEKIVKDLNLPINNRQ